jgi:UDP-2,3-diacylglucosamine hydrolase
VIIHPTSTKTQTPEEVYIAADLHLGTRPLADSQARERRFCAWLDSIYPRAAELILLGDVFDFWFEYRQVVPRGYVRLLGRLAHWIDTGRRVTVYRGNHDMWYGNYLTEELGIEVLDGLQQRVWFGRTYALAHGDGRGPGDYSYKRFKRFIRHPWVVRAFRALHPDVGWRMALQFSDTSRKANADYKTRHYGDHEFLYQYAVRKAAQLPEVNYFVFGHRHYPERRPVSATAELIVLGDWLTDNSYIRISPTATELLRFVVN